MPVLDVSSLPISIRPLVERALRTGVGREVAIGALQGHLYEGGERSANVLAALATLTYHDAAELMVNRMHVASERAVRLLDEAILRCETVDRARLTEMRDAFENTRQLEASRRKKLRALLEEPAHASARDLIALAHDVLMSGEDDARAAEIMRMAADATENDPPS